MTFGIVAGPPTKGLGLLTLRTNVWSGTIALLDELYVEPTRRSAGLGSDLLELALEEAGRRGATEFEVEVDEPDTDAQRFYARHSLSVIDPESGDHAFIARRQITNP
ncbi:GNAT family N-acetyltransferase [Aeromicrobium sp. CF4.19]|uniref:GNAT family N-acetyltransferase n=1 Tax=Aeromicrobium sp. CF4.19 TaxID=3373082 RepID=UPI003EE59DC4